MKPAHAIACLTLVSLGLTACAQPGEDEDVAGDSTTGGGTTDGGPGSLATDTGADPPGATDTGSGDGVDPPGTDDGTTETGAEPPPVVVLDCDALPAAGTFESILPPGVTENFALAADPVNAGIVYLGTSHEGFWKSEDCGSTWVHISTGVGGDLVDAGRNWSLVVDPIEPETVYTVSGYGHNGALRSDNGGVDWTVVWPPPDGSHAGIVSYDFANMLAIDPGDHEHLLLTFHAGCSAPYEESCIAETFDRGQTWSLVSGDPAMVGFEGQVIYFLDDASTWLWASQSSGFWRTADSGQSWTQVAAMMNEAHPQGSQLYRAADGTFYVAAVEGVFRSSDGIDWSLVPDTGPLAGGLVGDGETMYLSNNFYWDWGTNLNPYLFAPEATGAPWTPLAGSPPLTAGGSLAIDTAHRVLYSSNLGAGFWRVTLP